jgi:hypothetical protein
MPKCVSSFWQISLFNAILFASLITQISSATLSATLSDIVEEKGVNVLPVLPLTPESPGKQIDEFLEKLENLKQNPPKKVEGTILCEETRLTREFLEKILAFLELLDDLTERMNPYRNDYPSLASFDDKFHARCTQSIEEMKVTFGILMILNKTRKRLEVLSPDF